MKLFHRLAAALAIAVLAPAAGAAFQGAFRAGVGITVYEDINFGGRSANFVREVNNLRTTGLDARISSLKIAPGEFWEVCDGRDFGGRCQVFSGDQADLRNSRWSDRISSLRPVRGMRGRPVPDSPGPLFSPLELFAGRDFSGQRVAISEPTADLKRQNFADRAISLRVPRGQTWEVCVNVNYDDCKLVDGDVPDLNAIGLSRLISSVRPHDIRARGGDFRPEARVVLYLNPGFRGRSMTLGGEATELNFFNSLDGSVQINGGRWELCDRPRFGGNCVTLTGSVSDLRTLSLRGPVMSVRER